ncbi:MAG: hypothetical protein EA383_15195 [Spirochaetaceae bacterium]|nr:MAG: hypothetical protein EA383_15195 [Spirochaetaceae bacterium]
MTTAIRISLSARVRLPTRERWWLRRDSFATHRYVNLPRLAARINGGGGVRGIARELGCSPKVVLNRIGRLARGALGERLRLGHDDGARLE